MAYKKVAFHIEFKIPPKATPEECLEYLVSALKSERGCRRKEDPMAKFNPNTLWIQREPA